MKPKLLFLDDDKERQKAFLNNTIGADTTIVETAEQAILALQQNDFDYACLDHDLGGTVFAPSDEKSGYEVAKWLSTHPERMPKNVILHSLNEPARKNMKALLPDATECPFVWDKIQITPG